MLVDFTNFSITTLKNARRRLGLALFAFVICICAPLSLLIHYVHLEVRRENARQAQEWASDILAQLSSRVAELLRSEQLRPFSDYSFFDYQSNFSLNKVAALRQSPLAYFPPRTDLPGLVGYFQIATDGVFESPLLPQINPNSLDKLGELIPEQELSARYLSWNQLRELVASGFDIRELDVAKQIDLLIESPKTLSKNWLQQEPKINEKLKNPAALSKIQVAAANQADTFSVKLARQRYLIISRRINQATLENIQGFVINLEEFIHDLISPLLATTTSIEQIHYDILFANELIYSSSTKQTNELATSNLQFPLGEVSIKLFGISTGSASTLAYKLVSILVLVVIFGSIAIYALTARQLELAEMRSNFVAAVSHELRTPLTSIRLYAESLSNNWLSNEEKKVEYLGYIKEESERLSRLVNNVLDFSKLAKGDQRLALELHSCSSVLDYIERCISNLVREKHFKLNVLRTDDLLKFKVMLNLDALAQIFINLADNATKFSAQSQHKFLDLGCRLESMGRNSKLVFYLRDYGPGIAQAERKKIFSLFYRIGDELTRKTSGTGLGLALVYELSRKIQASVEAVPQNPGLEIKICFSEQKGTVK